MSGHKLIFSVIAVMILSLNHAAFAAGGSLPLRAIGTAITLGAADDISELKTEVNIAMVDDATESGEFTCGGETKAQLASGVLKIGEAKYAIKALCFEEASQMIKVLAVTATGEAQDKATLQAVLDVTSENRRSLKGRLIIKKDTPNARRFLIKAAEVKQTLPDLE